MATIDFNAPSTSTNNGNGRNADKPKSKLWLNIGVMIQEKDEQGNPVETQVTLPFGLALDTMQPMPGNTKLAKRKNDLLEKLQRACFEAVQPGNTEELKGSIRLFVTHVDGSASTISEEDAALMDQVKLNFG